MSHAGADRAWAEWVAWQLEKHGHGVELACWDWGAGDDFVEKMNTALERRRFLALYSEAYFAPERYTTLEWEAMVAVREGIVPLRVAEVTPPRILAPFLAPDLFGLDPDQARAVLLRAVNGPQRPTTEPPFPGGVPRPGHGGDAGPRLPGSLPRVWNLPARNAAFTGRDTLLVGLRESLTTNQKVAIQALHGRGGVGKTQLAIEYGHRFASFYELAWWIPAENPTLIPAELAQLAVRIGAAPAGTSPEEAVDLLLAELRTRQRWLLVFDNAEHPRTLDAFLPGGTNGHVLITSRNPNWHHRATSLDVTVLTRTESHALLRTHGTPLTDVDADHLADALDDLPLALAQAAVLLADGLPATDLRTELADSTAAVLDEGCPADYPVSLAAQVRLTTTRLHTDHPGAAALLNALALLAPEPFPLTTTAGHLPDQASAPLTTALASRLTALATLRAVNRHSLARTQNGTLQLHRLTQRVLAHQLTPDQREQARQDAEALLTAAHPGDVTDPANWPEWLTLLPHLLATDPTHITTPAGREILRAACWYLMDQGQPHPARERLQQLYDTWTPHLGPDHDDTLRTAVYLARAYDDTQDHERARALDEDALARYRTTLGEDHPATLTTASNLAIRLAAVGRVDEAVVLDEETLARRRRVLGEEHPDTLATASNLAIRLGEVGRVGEAVVLGEETLARMRRVLGEEHPDTLLTASNLAVRLAAVGRVGEAVVLGEETLARRRTALGEEHPYTLDTASNLAIHLGVVGRLGEAVVLGEETLVRRRRVLGEEHPDTLVTARWLKMVREWRNEAGPGQ